MSKRNSDGDVIANRLSLVEAKGQRLLATLFGSRPESTATSNGAKSLDADDDLKEDFGHDRYAHRNLSNCFVSTHHYRLGVGAIAPKDAEEGSFTRRNPAPNDKLLEQLLGKKKAKAHLTAQREAARPNAKAQRPGRAKRVEKEESEDEEEGRAAAFKSKRRKAINPEPKGVERESDDEDEESRTKPPYTNGRHRDANNKPTAVNEAKDERSEIDEAFRTPKVSKSGPRKSKGKPTSFLDEILADRSKKKSKKNKG